MIKKVSLGIVVGIGAVWVLATFVLGLWGKTAAADRLTADLEPAFSSTGVHQASADAAAVDAFTTELQTKTIPFLAAQLNTTPQDATKLLAADFPAVGKVLGTKDNSGAPYRDNKPYLDHASAYLNGVAAALQGNQGNFDKASNIPTTFLPTRAVAGLFLVLGLTALALGLALVRQPDLRVPVAAGVALLGVVVIAVTFAVGVPGKTRALDNLTTAFRPVFTTQGPSSIAEGQRYLRAVRAADVELETKVIPALPGLLKATPEATAGALRKNSPIVASALLDKDPANAKDSVLAGIVGRFDSLAGTVRQDIPDFNSTDAIPGLGWPARAVTYLLVGPAILLLLAALAFGAPEVAVTGEKNASGRLLNEVSG